MTNRPQNPHDPYEHVSAYQSREAMELRALLHSFIAWLETAGALVQEPTSKWEVLRCRALSVSLPAPDTVDPDAKTAPKPKPVSSVIYRNKMGTITWKGESRTLWALFRSGQPMPTQPEITVPKKSKSWTQRMREALIERDGTDCWFCGKTMIGHDHTGRVHLNDKGEVANDITIEHVLSRHNTDEHAADGVDINHIDYLVLAHAKCNRDIGHRPVSEKLTYREILHDQRSTMWAHPEIETPRERVRTIELDGCTTKEQAIRRHRLQLGATDGENNSSD